MEDNSDIKQQPSPALIAASRWYAKLASGHVQGSEIDAWKKWKASNPENQQAWQQLEETNLQFQQVSSTIALATLKLPSSSRRRAMKHLALLVSAGTVSWYSYREQPWREMIADYSTDVGAQREIVLADGTHLHLNTDTAVNIHFTDTERLVVLIKGEVLIETGHENIDTYRPFKLNTRHGLVTAIGTRFNVRDHGKYGKVSLYEGAVKVNPKSNQSLSLMLKAGESVEFSANALSNVNKAHNTDATWSKGILVVYAMRLEDFAIELSRYRSGVLRCDPGIANLAISGAFPINDTDAALEALPRTLPVRIETFTRYWTSIRPA